MTNAWYRTGTVATTNGSPTVTGTGTAWLSQVNPGDTFTIDESVFWEVVSVASNTSMTLERNYTATASGQSYAIIKTSPAWKTTSALFASITALYERLALGATTAWGIAKATVGANATLDFSTGGSLRARIGTIGSNALEMQTSADGAAWNDAILIANATGKVTFPVGVTSVSADAGAVGTPAFTFLTDPNSGMYSVGADQIGFATGGTESFRVGNDSALAPLGSAALPGYGFIGDTDTGLFRQAANALGLAAGGVEGLRITATGPLLLAGTVSAPSLAAIGDTNTGMWFPAAEQIAWSTNGVERARLTNTGLGIGVTVPAAPLHIFGSGAILLEKDTSGSSITARHANATPGHSPTITQQRARGTSAAPTAVQSGDILGTNAWAGHDGSAYTGTAAQIIVYAEETFSASAGGAYMSLRTRAIGGTGSPTERIRIAASGNVGIGTTAPDDMLVVAGIVKPSTDNARTLGTSARRWSTVYAATGTINTSDARLKADVQNCRLGLQFVQALRPVSYRWLVGGNDAELQHDDDGNLLPEKVAPRPGKRHHLGLIAQEVKAALDTAGVDCGLWVKDDPSNPESTESLRYDQLIAPLIAAVQELAARVETLERAASKA